MPANPDNLRAWIPRQRNRWLDLYLAGRAFGGRPGEAPLELTGGSYDGTDARLEFSDGERLLVHAPSGFLTADGGLTIPDASEVRFAWYAYGTTRSSENRCELTYRLLDGIVTVAAEGPATAWQSPERFPLHRAAMVRLS